MRKYLSGIRSFCSVTAVCVVMLTSTGSAQQIEKTAGLKGHIRQLTEYNYEFAGTNAVEEDGGAWKVTSVFDETGVKISEHRYGADGLLLSKATYRYGPSGRVERETNYDPMDRFLYMNTWSYDKKGRELSRKHRSRDRTMFLKTEMSYDPRGFLAQERTSAPGGRTISMAEWKYDTTGLPLEEKTFDADEKVTRTTRYRYDAQRRLIAESNKYYDITVSTTYSYDSAGNMAEQKDFSADRKLQKRTEYSYNARGEETEQRVYNAFGALQTTVKYHRTYDGMGNLIRTVQVGDEGESVIQQREIIYFSK